MVVAIPAKQWTLEELHSLPDDGNKYELVRGQLFVTPPPAAPHETVLSRLHSVLQPYVQRHGLGHIYRPRAVVRVAPNIEVEPDLFVSPAVIESWDSAPLPILVVEVTSPSTRRRDHTEKRQLYLDLRIPTCWLIDPDDQGVRVVRPNHPDTLANATLMWHPTGAAEALSIDVAALLRI